MVVPPAVRSALVEHSEAESPNEACGVVVFRDGEVLEGAMKSQRLAVADFLVAAREQGIRRTSDIEYAVLEADGRLSFFPYEEDQTAGAPEKPDAG